MEEKNQCSLCKGTGYEEHKFIREDGEEVTERIVCELCFGLGRMTNKSNCELCQNEVVSFESEMYRDKREQLTYISWEENY